MELEKILWSDVLSSTNKEEVKNLLSWLANLKMFSFLEVEKLNSWNKVREWSFSNGSLSHERGSFFEVVGVKAEIIGREVSKWDQPLVRQYEHGISALLISSCNGSLFCLVQVKSECGAFDHLEFAPTVQCIVGSYKNPEVEIPFLDQILNENKCRIIIDTLQSEEGGRFYKEQNRNIVSFTDEMFEISNPYYRWTRVKDLRYLVDYNNLLNIELRTIFAILMPI
jgi:oxidase EvaA